METLSDSENQDNLSEKSYSELRVIAWNAFLDADEATLSEVVKVVKDRVGPDDSTVVQGGSGYTDLALSLERDIDRLRRYKEM